MRVVIGSGDRVESKQKTRGVCSWQPLGELVLQFAQEHAEQYGLDVDIVLGYLDRSCESKDTNFEERVRLEVHLRFYLENQVREGVNNPKIKECLELFKEIRTMLLNGDKAKTIITEQERRYILSQYSDWGTIPGHVLLGIVLRYYGYAIYRPKALNIELFYLESAIKKEDMDRICNSIYKAIENREMLSVEEIKVIVGNDIDGVIRRMAQVYGGVAIGDDLYGFRFDKKPLYVKVKQLLEKSVKPLTIQEITELLGIQADDTGVIENILEYVGVKVDTGYKLASMSTDIRGDKFNRIMKIFEMEKKPLSLNELNEIVADMGHNIDVKTVNATLRNHPEIFVRLKREGDKTVYYALNSIVEELLSGGNYRLDQPATPKKISDEEINGYFRKIVKLNGGYHGPIGELVKEMSEYFGIQPRSIKQWIYSRIKYKKIYGKGSRSIIQIPYQPDGKYTHSNPPTMRVRLRAEILKRLPSDIWIEKQDLHKDILKVLPHTRSAFYFYLRELVLEHKVEDKTAEGRYYCRRVPNS